MSLNVLLICEHHTKDGPMLKPIFKQLFAAIGKPKANVKINTTVEIHGWSQALNHDKLREVFETYPLVHLFILCVDRDGDDLRDNRVVISKEKCRSFLKSTQMLAGELAKQEAEVWVLAGLPDLPPDWSWAELRSSIDAKEHLSKYAALRGMDPQLPAPLRASLGEAAGQRYHAVRKLCDEIATLEEAIRDWLATRQ